MIAFEVVLLVVLGAIIVVGIRAIAGPMTQAYAENVRFRNKDLGSQAEVVLKQRVEFLENEVRDVKQQLAEVQQSMDLVLKQKAKDPAADDLVIHLTEKEKA